MNNGVCIIRSNPVKPDSRVEKEAWTLAKAGYKVHILAWDRDKDHREENESINICGVDIPITRFGHKAAYSEGMRSIRPYLHFQYHVRKWLKQHENEYDIIHACDFHTAFFSQSFSKKKKFVFDIFDFVFERPQNIFQKLIKNTQIRIVNKADATIICTEERREQIAEAKPKRLVVIHNTPSTELVNPNSGLVFQSNTEKVKIAYVGILTDERMLTAIGHYIALHDDIELHIAGFGQLEPLFVQLSNTCNNVFWYGRIPYDQALKLESICDIMTAIYNPSIDNCRLAAPNKFYEGLMLGKPLIMVKGTGMSSVVEENDIGELIEFDEVSFGRGIERLIMKKNEWANMSERMRTLYSEKYSWETMRNRLIALYSELVLEEGK